MRFRSTFVFEALPIPFWNRLAVRKTKKYVSNFSLYICVFYRPDSKDGEMRENQAILNTIMYKEKLETYFFVFLTARRFQKGIGSASNTKVERNYKSIYTRRSTHPRNTEHAIETKETMQIEQKVIVLRTK